MSEKCEKLIIDDPLFWGMRIDKAVAYYVNDNLSRSHIVKLIEDKNILVNGEYVAKNYKLKENDEITVFIPPLQLDQNIKPENLPVNIVFEDDDIIVVNKPKDMVVHPANGNYSGTLVNALLYHCKDNLSGINGIFRPGIVHRIDKNTSGLLIVAKNDYAHIMISEQLKQHTINRIYHAVVYGKLKNQVGTIKLPIGRSKVDRKKMCVTYKNSKPAITNYKLIKEYKNFSYIQLKLDTGRTHQIRVHMSYIGHPIAGDDVYGPKKVISYLNGQCLHAKTIGFIHPTKKEYIEFDSSLPDYFINFLSELETSKTLDKI